MASQHNHPPHCEDDINEQNTNTKLSAFDNKPQSSILEGFWNSKAVCCQILTLNWSMCWI